MEALKISPTKYIPEIDFNPEAHRLLIRGNSYPENTAEFYAPVFSWLESYLEKIDQEKKVTVDIELTYFNSSSSKVLMNIFDMLEESARAGKQITINWFYDRQDENMLEFGEEFEEDFEFVRFKLIPKNV